MKLSNRRCKVVRTKYHTQMSLSQPYRHKVSLDYSEDLSVLCM